MNNLITINDLEDALKNNNNWVLLDVRKPEAYDLDSSMIPGARYRPPAEVDFWMNELPRDATIVVYCVHGHEISQGVCSKLREAGYDARYLEGGIENWKSNQS